MINKKILISKIVIYKSRLSDKTNTIKMVKRMLHNELCIEEYEANLCHTETNFRNTWVVVFDDLKNTFYAAG